MLKEFKCECGDEVMADTGDLDPARFSTHAQARRVLRSKGIDTRCFDCAHYDYLEAKGERIINGQE